MINNNIIFQRKHNSQCFEHSHFVLGSHASFGIWTQLSWNHSLQPLHSNILSVWIWGIRQTQKTLIVWW
jgi:hypothetical protein